MRRYSEAVKADIRKRMSPPARQSVARISEETGIHICTLYAWRKAWRLEGEVVPASHKDPEGWSAADKFTVVLETAGLNATELSAYCRERGLYPEQVERWRQASQDLITQIAPHAPPTGPRVVCTYWLTHGSQQHSVPERPVAT